MPTLLAGGGGGIPQPLDGGHSMPQPLDGGHSTPQPLDGGHSMPQPLDGGHSPGYDRRSSAEQCHTCNSSLQLSPVTSFQGLSLIYLTLFIFSPRSPRWGERWGGWRISVIRGFAWAGGPIKGWFIALRGAARAAGLIGWWVGETDRRPGAQGDRESFLLFEGFAFIVCLFLWCGSSIPTGPGVVVTLSPPRECERRGSSAPHSHWTKAFRKSLGFRLYLKVFRVDLYFVDWKRFSILFKNKLLIVCK